MEKIKKRRRKRRFRYPVFLKKLLKPFVFFYLLELKCSYNNFYINCFKITSLSKIQVYYISTGIVFENSAKTDRFSSIKMLDIMVGYITYNKIKRVIVKVLSLDKRIKNFIFAFNNFKKLKFGFFFLFFINYLTLVFNGVKKKKKKR